MTYDRAYNYTLGDKMKKQFRGRGAALNGMHASSTSELLKRAQMGGDPRVNCSEEAFFDSYRAQRAKSGGRTSPRAQYSREERRAESVSYASSARRETPNAGSGQTGRKNIGPAPITPSLEISEPAKSTPYTLIIIILVGAMMLMALIFSMSEVYRATNEISRLENQLSELENHAELLEMKLEEKNDVELIERLAREELGMVGEESVQRRYISLSGGEHIEIYEEPEDEASDGVILSSVFTALGDFFGRFK